MGKLRERKDCGGMLTFNLKKEWFEKIKSGKKTHEYREQTKYWIKRISNLFINAEVKRQFLISIETGFTFESKQKYLKDKGIIIFACGYPKKENKAKRLLAKIKNIRTNIDGNESDLEINEPVFDIEFELIGDK